MNLPVPTPPLVKKWQQWFLSIRNEILSLLHQREIYREIVRIVQANADLPKTSVVYDWIARGHGHSTAAGVRRLVDMRRNTISFRRLLDEIARHPGEITRSWVVSHYPQALRYKANGIFDTFAPKGGDIIEERVIRTDIEQLTKEVDRIKQFVDEHVAHHAVAAKPAPTFAELHQAIDALSSLANRYAQLLIQGGTLKPVILEDWLQVFRVPWASP